MPSFSAQETKAASGICGIAGFTAHQIFIGIFTTGNNFHQVDFQLSLGQLFRGGKFHPAGEGNPAQKLIGEKCPSNHGKVIGGSVMVFIRQAVGVGEMGIQAAKLFCPADSSFPQKRTSLLSR